MLSWEYAKKTIRELNLEDSVDLNYPCFENHVENWPHVFIVEELDESFVLLLKEWKKNPPSKEVLTEFKQLINQDCDPYIHYGPGGTAMDIFLEFAEGDDECPYPNIELIGLLIDFGMETSKCLGYIEEKIDPLIKIRDIINQKNDLYRSS